MTKKIIVVDAHYQNDEPFVKVFEELDSSLVNELANELSNLDNLETLFKNPNIANMMADMGYVNVNELKDVEEKVKLTQKFYVNIHGSILPIFDLNKIRNHQLSDLANENAVLLQVVDKDATLKNFPQAWKVYKAQVNALLRRKKATLEAKKKRANKLLEKKVAKAKALLATIESGH